MQGALDRSDVVQQATRLVNRGDLNGAVRIYVRLFEEDSRDWSVGNTLGDLYVRLGKADDAITHFSVLAEQLAADGFAAKARALYRKILRIEPANALARQRVDELERQQVGQTSPFLQRVLETARNLRETEAASLPPKAPQVEGAPPAQARETPGEAPRPAAPEPSSGEPSLLEPRSVHLPPVQPTPAQPTSVQATPVGPTFRSGVSGPGVAPLPQSDAEWADEWAAVMSSSKPERPAESAQAAVRPPEPPLGPEPPPRQADSGTIEAADEFHTMEAEADASAAQHDYRAAVAIVEDFLAGRPHHIAALEKLIDLGVDGGLGIQLVVAQVRLADACLRAERYAQAYYTALDLIARYPDSDSHRALLDRVRAVAREHGRTFPPLPNTDVAVRPIPVTDAPAPAPAPARPAQAAPASERPPVKILRPDFSDAPRDGRAKPEGSQAEIHAAAPATTGPLAELLSDLGDPDQAFEDFRDGLLEEAAAVAEERFAEATRLIESHRLEEAARALEEAMCAPHLRSPAGSRLARIYREQGAAMEALTCLEWVAEIPPSSEESGHELAYELALTLEVLGQHAQALGLYRELLAEVGSGYRDIEERAQRLAAA